MLQLKKIKVMVVDDSAFMRKVIADILERDPEIEVVYKARNGLDATEKVKQFSPDVMTLDVEMPGLNGLQTLEWLMENHPLPVVMVSSLTQEGTDTTIRALEQGAVDVIGKPSGSISLDIDKVGDDLIGKVKGAARSKILRQPALKSIKPLPQPDFSRRLQIPRNKSSGNVRKLILVGTSTGGPKALQHLLSGFPSDINAAILIVQHMPAGFTQSLANRLDSLYSIRVVEAKDGQEIENGTAYIAPGDFHMEVVRDIRGALAIRLNQEPPRGGHRPSVNVLFESAAKIADIDKYVVIMTGMGNDGTQGLIELSKSGIRLAIAEDRSTCVVYGMPRAAAETGHVDHILPLTDITKFLIDHLA